MSNDKLKGLLMCGKDIEYQGFKVRNYSLDEIFSEDFGLDKYYYLISFANLEAKDIIAKYKLEDAENKSKYEILWEVPDTRYWFLEVLNTFTYLEWSVGDWEDYLAYEDKKHIRFAQDKFDGFIEVLKKMYCINKSKIESSMELNPDLATSDEAREMAKEFAEFENQNKKKSGNITIMGIINALAGKGRGYTYFNIWDLKMYQLMGIYYGIEQDDQFKYTMESVYHGVWDTKKNPLDYNKIHWAVEKLPD